VDLDGASAATTVLDLPVRGPWMVQNSPADRVPSHGTQAFGGGIAGNHVVLALGDGGPVVLLAHLRRGSIRVAVGDPVRAGDVLAQCGNSGNSTQPHLHLQVSSSTRWEQARGLPMAFRHPVDGRPWLPRNGDIIDA